MAWLLLAQGVLLGAVVYLWMQDRTELRRRLRRREEQLRLCEHVLGMQVVQMVAELMASPPKGEADDD